MSGGDWNPFEKECRVRAAAGGDDRNWSRLCSRLTSAAVGSVVAFFLHFKSPASPQSCSVYTVLIFD